MKHYIAFKLDAENKEDILPMYLENARKKLYDSVNGRVDRDYGWHAYSDIKTRITHYSLTIESFDT